MLKRIHKLYFVGMLCFMLCLVFPATKVYAEPDVGGNAQKIGVVGGPYYDKSNIVKNDGRIYYDQDIQC